MKIIWLQKLLRLEQERKTRLKGVKHIIQCHCILPQYRAATFEETVFHKFIVFSIIDKKDNVISKLVNCNNCGATHRVFDLCKSEIVTGSEDIKSVMKIEDFKLSIPQQLYDVLNSYNLEIHDFEFSQFIIDNQKWDSTIVLSKEEVDNKVEGKLIRFLGPNKFRIESFARSETLE